MKTIETVKKLKKTYQIHIKSDSYEIEPEVYLKFHIKPGLEIEEKIWKELIAENDYLRYYKLGIIKLKKMLTRYEMKNYLLSVGASEGIIKQVISKFVEKRYLDDLIYTKEYIQMKKYQYGPLVLEHQLREKGVDFDLIKAQIDHIDEQEILLLQLPKKLSSIKNKSKRQAILTVKTHFIRNGYTNQIVSSVLEKSLDQYQGDELKLIQRDYEKLYLRLSKKFSGYELKSSIKEKLYQKGYTIEDIQKVLN
ncbi:MAG: RecX family transcriptional regulator [Firmicutes bacterium]|nr:RecX family transcriptional regulator [Bacillota bacterium]